MKKAQIFNNHFQNFKTYAIPKAQLIIADIPYNLGNNAYASNPAWYKDGDNSNGEANLQEKVSLIRMKILDQLSLCIFVARC